MGNKLTRNVSSFLGNGRVTINWCILEVKECTLLIDVLELKALKAVDRQVQDGPY